MSRDTTTGKVFEKQTRIAPLLLSAGYIEEDGVYTSSCGSLEVTLHYQGDIFKKKTGLLEKLEAPNRYDFSKQKNPDEGILIKNLNDNSLKFYVVEKKFQKTNGSADEKLETIHCKTEWFQNLFAGTLVQVEYVYLLNDWFLQYKYNDVRKYFARHNYKVMYEEYDLELLGLI